MVKLVELNSELHKDLKVRNNCGFDLAKKAHLLNIRVSEIGYAQSDFAVFITQLKPGKLATTIVTSFQPELNLFIDESTETKRWDATYIPVNMQVYPLCLVESSVDPSKPALGFNAENKDVNADSGEALFTATGEPSLFYKHMQAALEEDARNAILTFQFTEYLESKGLIRALNIVLHYTDGTQNTIRGLQTINEDKLQSLDKETVAEMHVKGYFGPVYAMLFSVYQLNALIRRNNHMGQKAIQRISLELDKT